MVYSLTYRRPPYAGSSASLGENEKARSIGESTVGSQGSGMSFGIPDALSFDRIINGGTCPVGQYSDIAADLKVKMNLSIKS